ncbi:MAG: helix-turn-helix transcriptional regulator [Sedimentisphaerales bacterium]|nr:helix-turn-helix transcriptional regulator [Sedimentisphaerales bacterium]
MFSSKPLQQYLAGQLELAQLFQSTLRQQIKMIQSDHYTLKVPQVHDQIKFVPNAHFHVYPEVFIQLSGLTKFQFHQEKFTLYPGQICLMPRTVNHAEKAADWRGPFNALVICPVSKYTTCHIGQAQPNHIPEVTKSVMCQIKNINTLLSALDDITTTFHTNPPAQQARIKGTLLTAFAIVLEALQGTQVTPEKLHFTTVKCKQMIANDSANPDLSVEYLAQQLHCSADYLSHLFHREAGIKLTQYINEERITKAKYLLETSSLNIAETARACGYRDQSYFARVFRKNTGQSPRDFRKL